MLYFKDSPLTPSKIDVTQFAALQNFRKSLSEIGGLYATFEDLAGFEASLRAHLTAVAQKLINISKNISATVSQSVQLEDFTSIEDDENGLNDYLDIYDTRGQDMIAAMSVIKEATVRVGEQLSQRSSEKPAHGVTDVSHAKRLAKRASEDMTRYADTLAVQVPVLSSARQEAFAAMSSAVALMADFQSSFKSSVQCS